MSRGKIIGILLVLVLLLATLSFAANYAAVKRQLSDAEQVLDARRYNEKALTFMKLFIGKVLKAEGEVSFEDRLQLENTVRDLNDAEVISAWNTFVNAKSEAEAQEAVKDLLDLLASRISAA